MRVNYLEQIVQFHRWKDINPLPASAIALWFELMAVCNKAGWPEEFTVANGTLQSNAGLSRKEFDRARSIVTELGLVHYTKSERVNNAGKYSMIPIVQKGQQKEHQEVHQNGQQEDQQKVQQNGHQEGHQKEHERDNERDTLFKHKSLNQITTTTTTGVNLEPNLEDLPPFLQVIRSYCELHARADYHIKNTERELAKKMIAGGMPVPFIIESMKFVYAFKKKREELDGGVFSPPSSFMYYDGPIHDAWREQQKGGANGRDGAGDGRHNAGSGEQSLTERFTRS